MTASDQMITLIRDRRARPPLRLVSDSGRGRIVETEDTHTTTVDGDPDANQERSTTTNTKNGEAQ